MRLYMAEKSQGQNRPKTSAMNLNIPPFESSPIHGKLSSPVHGKLSQSRNAAMDVFRELLDAATYPPALLTQLLARRQVRRPRPDSASRTQDGSQVAGSSRALAPSLFLQLRLPP
ncbi:hypothetical protein EJB05_27277, partial [Eragrostis curvula]